MVLGRLLGRRVVAGRTVVCARATIASHLGTRSWRLKRVRPSSMRVYNSKARRLSASRMRAARSRSPQVPAAAYTLVVSREGFETVRARLEVTLGLNPAVEIRLPFALALREMTTVVGRTVGELGLTGASPTASRLGLPAIDIPASIDVLDSRVMEARGYQKVSDAVRHARRRLGRASHRAIVVLIRGFTATRSRICATASGWVQARW